ncbi:MAG: lytic transglycosylase domain-containing protein, partial [Proteobacteria bacterium]|nr:lytic transglycosylase domain-containing protein [Pseudomonadota bacterium]MBU1742480.1 lytic transglycosylase domain-containing protein [Pseudomonadota bacterium]
MTPDRSKINSVFWASLLCAAAVAWPAPAATGDQEAIQKLVRRSRQTYRRAQIAYWNGFPRAAFRLYRQSLAGLKRARTLAPGRFIDRFRRIDAAFYQDMVKLSQAMFGVGSGHYQQGKAASACGLFWRSLRLVRFAEELSRNRYQTRFRRVYFRIAQDFGRVIRPRDLPKILTACTGRMRTHLALARPARVKPRTPARRQPLKTGRLSPRPKRARALRFDPRQPWVRPVRGKIRWLTVYRRGFLKRSLKRAERHLPMIRRVFKAYGIPRSLAYMALIESGFRTSPTSRAGARGLWQFIPSTARSYGLRVNRRVDDRLDPVKSTYAAAMFLTDLYKKFKDWPLAVA